MNQPKTIYWSPQEGLKFPALKKSGTTWQIYTQQALKLEPGEKKTIGLFFGYMLTDGLILLMPTGDIKKILEFKNPFLCDVKKDNITTMIYNFSDNTVLIPENTAFCFVKYLRP